MSRLIDADALKKAIEVAPYNDIDDLTRTERLIDDTPTIEPILNDAEIQQAIEVMQVHKQMLEESPSNQLEGDKRAFELAIEALKSERPQGAWIHYLGCGVGKAVCSECGQLGETKKYCGNCGKRMRGGYS